MLMAYTRWYDKDNQIKIIMDTLEKIDDEIKISVAVDLIQIVMGSKITEADEFIDELNSEYVPVRRRWYDRNETLHSAVEMLKHVEGDEKRELLKEILFSIMFFSDSNKKNSNKKDSNI